jgi:hypothetical protein
MSTPAGIFTVSGTGKYKDTFSWTQKNKNGDIPAAFHNWSTLNLSNPNISNGCIRIRKPDLDKISNYVNPGLKIYTLPEQEGSRFFIRNGEINFSADTPYGGVDEKGKKGMKDYSTHTPTVTKDIQINGTGFARRKSQVFGSSDPLTGESESIESLTDTDYGRFISTIEAKK